MGQRDEQLTPVWRFILGGHNQALARHAADQANANQVFHSLAGGWAADAKAAGIAHLRVQLLAGLPVAGVSLDEFPHLLINFLRKNVCHTNDQLCIVILMPNDGVFK